MIVAGDCCYVDPGVLDVIVKGAYFREVHSVYFMRLGIESLKDLEGGVLDGF